jgi:hypothetical protein
MIGKKLMSNKRCGVDVVRQERSSRSEREVLSQQETLIEAAHRCITYRLSRENILNYQVISKAFSFVSAPDIHYC